MGTCLSDSSEPELAKKPTDPLVRKGKGKGKATATRDGEPCVPQEEEFRRTSRLIPYSDDDPIDIKIKKIHFRWRMNRRNLINYMTMLKFDSILQFSIANHLPPHDNATEYLTIDDLLYTLYQNGIQRSIFCQYWKMDKYISSRHIIEHHLQYVFTFKQWKVDEQISYVNESDLQLFETYNPVVNTKTLIKDYMKQGDVLVVLTPRWHEPATRSMNQTHNKQESTLDVESVIKVHSFTPFSSMSVNSQTNMISRDSSTRSPTVNAPKKSPFHFKMFQPKPHENASEEQSVKDLSTTVSPYNVINSDFEDTSPSHHELIPIKLTDFQKYITMQAMCTAVTIAEAELVTSRAHEKLKSTTTNHALGVLDINMNHGFDVMPKQHKKLTDLAEDQITDNAVIHHDSKPKYNRFYFTLCMDRTSALLKVQELVIQINEIIDDLSFLYSIVVEASLANLSASQYIHSMREKGAEHLLSLHSMSAPSFINICGGLAKYWSDIDNQRSILKRVQSALQFSALGSVFMYPKDYAARTKWKVGDPVMIFEQEIEKWCPGKIVTVYPHRDDIDVKYAVLHQPKLGIIPPTLAQGDEDAPAQGAITDMIVSAKRLPPKTTFTSTAMSMESVGGSFSGGLYSPKSFQSAEQLFGGAADGRAARGASGGSDHRNSRSKFEVISAKKYSAIDFDHDTTLETIKINRYDRDFLKPMIVQKAKRGSLSYTLDHKLLKTCELLDPLTGLGNAVRLNERLQDICNDVVLCGMNTDDNVDIIMQENDHKDKDEDEAAAKKKRYLNTQNVHPISLMFVEIDQLSSKINLDNRPNSNDRGKNHSWDDDPEKKYDEKFIMLSVSKALDSIGKHFNQYLTTAISQAGSEDLSSLLESRHSRTDSFLTTRISVNEFGKKGNSIRSEAFRYGNNVFALLLHNTDVAKSLLISRFIQKEIVDLCAATTEFKYKSNYLTVSMAIANLHYTTDNVKIMDSHRSWYKRCSDALKTIRYEGGNGVTHADVLFGVGASPIPSREQSHSYSGRDQDASGQLQIGIVHTAGSATSQPGLAHQSNSFDNHFDAFANNLEYMDDEDEEYKDMAAAPAQTQSPNRRTIGVGSPTFSVEPEPTSLRDLTAKKQAPVLNLNDQTATSNKKKNQTITWITGRLDRKYTFV